MGCRQSQGQHRPEHGSIAWHTVQSGLALTLQAALLFGALG
jgi:hypothetical protein